MSDSEVEDVDLENCPDDDMVEELCLRAAGESLPDEADIDSELDKLIEQSGDLETAEATLLNRRQDAVEKVLREIEPHGSAVARAVLLHEAAMERATAEDPGDA